MKVNKNYEVVVLQGYHNLRARVWAYTYVKPLKKSECSMSKYGDLPLTLFVLFLIGSAWYVYCMCLCVSVGESLESANYMCVCVCGNWLEKWTLSGRIEESYSSFLVGWSLYVQFRWGLRTGEMCSGILSKWFTAFSTSLITAAHRWLETKL